ncbi:MAG: flavodoxin family protein [Christensenellales bacterium]|jgi:flavodoxin
MNTLVVYDSIFGNTEKIAYAIGNSLGAKTTKITDLKPDVLDGIELLIVGSPTRAFRPTPAITDWIKGLPANLNGVKITAFDTRTSPDDIKSGILKKMMKTFGYAAKPIEAALSKKGGAPAGEPEGFLVTGSEGPLKDGELERAVNWASGLK